MKPLLLFSLCLVSSFAFAESPPASSPATPAPAQNQKHEKHFSKLDHNHDAFVDREEFNKARFAQKNAKRSEKRFARTDANNDGKLSKEEWLAAPGRKKGKGASA